MEDDGAVLRYEDCDPPVTHDGLFCTWSTCQGGERLHHGARPGRPLMFGFRVLLFQ